MPTTASIKINGGFAGLADTDLPLGTVVNLSNNDNTGVVSYEWVILSQPAGAQDSWLGSAPPSITTTEDAPQFTPTKEGSYLIRLTVNKNMADEATDTTICAVRELLTGDRIPAPQETTEVSDTDGWATAAVTKILQRVTRLSDAGIFVAQNASGGDLVLGKVVHMNGMTTIGTGTNERPIPIVRVANANLLELVDGPLGVMVGNRDGNELPVANGALCRVMVMGGIANYTGMGIGGVAGDPVFVDNAGNLSLTAGNYVRQVGDIARTIADGEYDIAISAGANSIPRGNAGGDLDGMYPDPDVVKINGTSVPAAAGAAVGSVLRLTNVTSGTEAAEWGPVDLANTNAVTGILPAANGGTGQNMTPTLGGIVYGTADNKLDITGPGTAGQLLVSAGGLTMPQWLTTLPVQNGGTGSPLALNSKGVVFALSGAQMATTPAGTAGQPLLSGGGGASNPAFGPLNLSTIANMTGTLPVSRGGTGQASALISGGLIVAQSTTAMTSLALPVADGSVLVGSATTAPNWLGKLPVASGGTNADLSGVSGLYGVVVKASSTTLGVTASGVTGDILVATTLALPTWQNFAAFFDAQYAGSSTSTVALFSTTGGAYEEIVAVTRSCKRGMVQVTPMPIAGGAAFINHITTATNGTYSTVSLRYVVTFPDVPATVQNYIYQFRSSTSSNNNQSTGSITFPSLTFYTSLEGNHTVSLQATISPSGDTFTANAIALRISQG